MVLDERSRHEMYRKVEEVLGPEAAATLIEHLPPVGWADVATKRDLAALDERMDLRFARVDESIKVASFDLRATFEHELRSQATSFQDSLQAQSTSFQDSLRTQSTTMVFALVSVVLTMAALAFAMVRFT